MNYQIKLIIIKLYFYQIVYLIQIIQNFHSMEQTKNNIINNYSMNNKELKVCEEEKNAG